MSVSIIFLVYPGFGSKQRQGKTRTSKSDKSTDTLLPVTLVRVLVVVTLTQGATSEEIAAVVLGTSPGSPLEMAGAGVESWTSEEKFYFSVFVVCTSESKILIAHLNKFSWCGRLIVQIHNNWLEIYLSP